jgi:hypothetical protein
MKFENMIRDLPPTTDAAPPYPPLERFVKEEYEMFTTAS